MGGIDFHLFDLRQTLRIGRFYDAYERKTRYVELSRLSPRMWKDRQRKNGRDSRSGCKSLATANKFLLYDVQLKCAVTVGRERENGHVDACTCGVCPICLAFVMMSSDGKAGRMTISTYALHIFIATIASSRVRLFIVCVWEMDE